MVYEPGIVEIQFKANARIRVFKENTKSSKNFKLISRTEVDLRPLEENLNSIQYKKIVNVFRNSTEDEYDDLFARAEKQNKMARNLNDFFIVHFPEEYDPVEIAKKLKQLPFVENAYPVPQAAPPDPQFEMIREAPRREADLQRFRTDYCRMISMIGPCIFTRIIDPACAGSTPLNEPLVGDRDTVYTVDTANSLENQWYIYRCNVDSAWALACGEGVVVADIDWGFRTTHQDLAGQLDMNHAYNAVDGSNTVNVGTDIDHGTAVMGLVGADDNNLGMIGIAYGATLWPIQANDGNGVTIAGNSWANAIDWVRTQQTDARRVIILEVQTKGTHCNYEMIPSVNQAIINAITDNIVVCVAAGNGNRDAGLDDNGLPITFTGSIVVGATAYNQTTNPRAWFSNWGPRVDVAAPGDASHDLTLSSSADDAYRNGFGGTSGATPKVAGTVAMMLQCNPNLTPSDVRDIIMTTASQTVVTEQDHPVGGFLDTYAAVSEACHRAHPCRDSLIVDHCKQIMVVGGCEFSKISVQCLKSNILVDPCRLKLVTVDGCITSKIVIGPCCTRELIAGDPFWKFEEFEDWEKAFERIKEETMKHFKQLTRK